MGSPTTTGDPQPSGIQLLGTHYSDRLKSLYDQVVAAYGRPIRVEPTRGHVDNTIEVRPTELLLRLRPGSSEDDVAHELIHPILQMQGYPQIFSVSILPLSQAIANIIRADLDHLVINQRLRALGYDPHKGFLKRADSYQGFLAMRPPTDQSQRAVFHIGAIHELLKFHYYLAVPGAEAAILERHPEVQPHWRYVRQAVDRLGREPTPADIWRVAGVLNAVADKICTRNSASFRFSDVIGFEPVPLARAQRCRKARDVFEETADSVAPNSVLLRTYLRRNRMMVAVHIIPPGSSLETDLELPVSEFVARREIKLLLISAPPGRQAAAGEAVP